jgi:hypothetical protein
MAGHQLAIYNFGLFVADYESPEVEGFRLREPLNFEAASRADGYIGRSGYEDEPGPESWGEKIYPRFIKGSGTDSAPSSLSLWADIESLMAFTYNGVHADALKHARNWNRRQQWPPLVLWWVEKGQIPQWRDGVERLEHLHDHGPAPCAFTFKTPYGPDGHPVVIDRARVREKADRNKPTQNDMLEIVRTLKV